MKKHISDLETEMLDEHVFPMDVVYIGQEAGIDWIDVAEYMRNRGFPPEVINTCFRVYTGKNLNFA